MHIIDKFITFEAIDHHRRHFFGTAALTVAAAQFGMIGAAQAQSNAEKAARLPAIKAGTRPERCKAMVSVSGYPIGNQEAGKVPLPPKAELQWWYQFYFATERGRQGYDKHPRDFSKLIWQIASPQWIFDDATLYKATLFINHDKSKPTSLSCSLNSTTEVCRAGANRS